MFNKIRYNSSLFWAEEIYCHIKIYLVKLHVRYKPFVCYFCIRWWHTYYFLSCPFRDSLLPNLSQENAFLDYQELLGRYLGRVWLLPTLQRGWDMWNWSNADLRCRLKYFINRGKIGVRTLDFTTSLFIKLASVDCLRCITDSDKIKTFEQ